MASKGLWQSMTGWITKSDNAPSSKEESESAKPRESAPPADPGASPAPGSNLDRSGAFGGLSPAPLNMAPPSGMPAGAPGGPAAVNPNPKPDEGPEINRKIIGVIKTCYDPEIPVNIYELGLIYDIQVNAEAHADVKMTLTAPNCPAAQSLPAEVKHKIEAMDEIKSANVEIVFDPPWTPNQMTDAAKLTLNIL